MLTRSLEKTGADRPLDFIPFSFHRDPPVILNFLPCHLICIHDRLDDPPSSSLSPFQFPPDDTAVRCGRPTSSHILPDTDRDRSKLESGSVGRGRKAARNESSTTQRRRRRFATMEGGREGEGEAEDTEIVDRIVPLTTSIRSNHSGWEKTKKGGYSGERVQARLPLDLWRRRTRRYAPSNIDFSISPRYTLDIRGKYRG